MPSPNPALTPERKEELDRDVLTPMIERYAPDTATREKLRATIDSSPALKDGLLFAIDKGALTALNRDDPGAGAEACYDGREKSIRFPSALMDNPNKAAFVLGHETGHAVDRAINGDHISSHFIPNARQMLRDSLVAPGERDYTDLVKAYVANDRRDEAEAHISGFNAIVSKLTVEHTRANVGIEDPLLRRAIPPTTQDLYTAYPDSMRDFMIVRGEAPDRTIAMKPGLTRTDDGSLSLDTGTVQGRNNIEAMKVYFADKLPSALGPNGALNYPHKALGEALDLAHKIEKIPGQTDDNHRSHYKVDFDRIGFPINEALVRTPPSKLIPSGPDFDHAYPGLFRDQAMGREVTGSQGLLSRRLLEQATSALEKIDEGRLGVRKDSPEFGTLCAYTAYVAGSNKITTIGCVIPSDKGDLIISNKPDPTDPSARLQPLNPAKAQELSGPEHMKKLGEATAPILLETYERQHAPKKPDNGCIVM